MHGKTTIKKKYASMSDRGPVLPQRAALRAYSYLILYVASLRQIAEAELMERAQQQCTVTCMSTPGSSSLHYYQI
jgi:hypothetical protein